MRLIAHLANKVHYLWLVARETPRRSFGLLGGGTFIFLIFMENIQELIDNCRHVDRENTIWKWNFHSVAFLNRLSSQVITNHNNAVMGTQLLLICTWQG